MMEMVLIRAPPSGLIIKAVCISLHLRKPQMPWHSELTHTHVRHLNVTIFCVGKDLVWPPHSKESTPIRLFFHSLISLSATAGGDWSLFQSCHRVASGFTLPLLHSAVFSVPFDRNNSWRWERSNECRLTSQTGRNVGGDAIFSGCTPDRNRKSKTAILLKKTLAFQNTFYNKMHDRFQHILYYKE